MDDRKKFYPPRPKRSRKSRNTKKKKSDPPVKLDTLRSCLSGLSQDSGIGSSQECPPLDLDQIVVPDQHLTPGTSQISTITETNETVKDDNETKVSCEDITSSDIKRIIGNNEEKCKTVQNMKKSESTSTSTDIHCSSKQGRKRHLSESSLSDFDPKKPKIADVKQSNDEKQLSLSQTSDLGSEISSSSFISSLIEKSSTDNDGLKNSTSDNSELCIFCNDAPKDAIFLHTKVAHQCCCYKCAKRTLKAIKRCPICNCTVNKVFRVIKS
ncbi:hypothetical protein NQ314_006846 [Rhamnusium bicolor]|uniref:Uncharacterized protein n=1 Tax=Rhamnusium bicolor TaxID=1586634 RepID=A0AAV8YW12_9CUCU|nr:hypothetical protein NQ314_006846 [Rhamnusium bicolor]